MLISEAVADAKGGGRRCEGRRRVADSKGGGRRCEGRRRVADSKEGEGSPVRRNAKVAGNAKSRRRFGVGIGKAKGRRECEESSAIWSGRRRVTGNAKSRPRLGVGIGKVKGRRECEESSAIWSGYREGEGSPGM